MATRDLALSRGASTLIFDPCIIKENPSDNTRQMDSLDTLAHIREMADVILSQGNECFPPITIYQIGEDIYVSAGWCRRRAHLLAMEEGAPIKGILCLTALRKKPEDLTLSILTSNEGLPLTAMEKAAAIKRLQSFLWTPADIASKTGWSITTVNNLIALYDAPESITNLVKTGQVSATLATEMVKERGVDGAKEVLEGAVQTAKKAGKSKATKSDIQGAKKAAVLWKTVGPVLYKRLKDIYECPVTNKAQLMDRISAAGDILAEVEDKMGQVDVGVGDEF